MVHLSQFVTSNIENLWWELDSLHLTGERLNPYWARLRADGEGSQNLLENNYG